MSIVVIFVYLFFILLVEVPENNEIPVVFNFSYLSFRR